MREVSSEGPPASTIARVMRVDDLLLLTGYTRDTPYEASARRLCQSALRYGLRDGVAMGYDSCGDVAENARFKARLISEFAKAAQAPFLWVDADSEIVRALTPMKWVEPEFGVRAYEGTFMTSVLYCDATATTRRLLRMWARDTEARTDEPIGELLYHAWLRMRRPSTYWLPTSMSRTIEEPDPSGDPPVIIHAALSKSPAGPQLGLE